MSGGPSRGLPGPRLDGATAAAWRRLRTDWCPAFVVALVVAASGLTACADTEAPVLSADSMPLHLEDHVADAIVTGAELPAEPPEPVEWTFDVPDSTWKAWPYCGFSTRQIEWADGTLRVQVTEPCAGSSSLWGGVYVDLPGWDWRDWSHILVRARTSDPFVRMHLAFNVGRNSVPATREIPFEAAGRYSPVVSDGTIQTYRIPVEPNGPFRDWESPWRQLILILPAPGPATIDLLSVTAVPRGSQYQHARAGTAAVTAGNRVRRSLFAHAPGRLEWPVQIPAGGRLDFAAAVLASGDSITFRVEVTSESGTPEAVYEAAVGDATRWWPAAVDLSAYEGRRVTLALETEARRPGTVAFWGAPAISAKQPAMAPSCERPNVILYVIDGAAADAMSVYGHARRTTPNLERLAQEGVVFERAHSNASWTKPSTSSFMTSLQTSVLGNVRTRFDPLPAEAVTMAERFHAAGWRTAVLTTNAWAGSMSGLERGVDYLRDEGLSPESRSAAELHREFREWREGSPGSPFWVHFQTTNVHSPTVPSAPFKGMFLDQPRDEWQRAASRRIREIMRGLTGLHEREAWDSAAVLAEVDRLAIAQADRDLYDEVMAQQDAELGKFIDRLKADGEWGECTVLVVASDHSYQAGISIDYLVEMLEDPPPIWLRAAESSPILRAGVSRIPLIFVWPGHIPGGRRIRTPVSMIDVLPTLLDLAGIPEPDVMQGRSLAPLLRGEVQESGFEARPVILDEFALGPYGELTGRLEVIDGRWGAAMWIGPPAEGNESLRRRWPVLVFDLLEDPNAAHPLNEERPDLVEKYTALLQAQWAAHQALATRFSTGGVAELTPEQLETLRSLGYIR